MMPAAVIAGVVIVGDCVQHVGLPTRRPARARGFASPKSSTFTVPSGRDLDVRRLQIAMNDPVLVRRFERLRDLPRDRQGVVEQGIGGRLCAADPRASALRRVRAPARGRRRRLRTRRIAPMFG